ncbi:MAG TPA: tetratricopeptide repeat protein, partial [Pyrinomonadaceae bacterium]
QEFIFDDIQQILQNPRIRSWNNIYLGFTSDVWEFGTLIATNTPPPTYYRPLFTAYLTVGYQIFGLWAPGWHLASILMHTGISVMLFYFLRRLSGNQLVAGMAALLFAIHPAHVESVAWISGITDPMLALFFIPALMLYMRYREEGKRRWLYLSLFLYACALLSKEPAVMLPGVIGVWEITRRQEGWKAFFVSTFWRLLPFAVITAAYMGARRVALGQVAYGKAADTTVYPGWVYLATIPRVIWEYLSHQLYPVRPSFMYDVPYPQHIYDWGVILPFASLALLAAFLFIKRKQLSQAAWLSLALIIMPLMPVLNLRAMNHDFLVHDRYFYLPSVGLCYLAALAIMAAARRRPKLGAPLVAVLVLTLGLSTMAYNKVWMDSRLLWTRAAEHVPHAYSANFNLGLAYLDHNEPEKARDYFLKSLSLNKNSLCLAQVYNNLTIIYMKLGETEEAIAAVHNAIKHDPRLMEAYNNLGLLYSERGDFQAAASQFRKGLEIVPASAMLHTNLARAFMDMGDPASAVTHYQAALSYQADDMLLRYQLSNSYAAAGDKQRAITELEWMLKQTDDPQVVSFLQSKLKALRAA